MAGLALFFALMNFLIVFMPKLCEQKSQLQVVLKGIQVPSTRETSQRFSESTEAQKDVPRTSSVVLVPARGTMASIESLK